MGCKALIGYYTFVYNTFKSTGKYLKPYATLIPKGYYEFCTLINLAFNFNLPA